MKTRFSMLLKKVVGPAILATAMVVFLVPAQALAANHGGGGGFHGGGGHGFSGGGHSYSRSYNGGGHTYSGGGHSYSRGYSNGGRAYNYNRGYRGGWNGRGYYGRGYYGRGGWGWGGWGLGVYAAPYYYGYGYAPCNPAGYYDQFGYWRYYPGCVVTPYGY